MRRLLIAPFAIALTALAGCGSADRPAPPQRGAAAPVARTIASIGPRDPQTPIETVKGDEGRLALLSVTRTGPAVVTAQFRLTMSDDGAMWSSRLSDGGEENDVSGARMLDEVHGRAYLPLRDDAGECICTGELDEAIGSGDQIELSVKFPAPPDDVDQVSVQLPGFPSFDQLPI
jgi:hypothetical protein